MSSINLVDLRLTRPPEGMKPNKLQGGKSKPVISISATRNSLNSENFSYSKSMNSVDFRGMMVDKGDDSSSIKSYHAMLTHFLQAETCEFVSDVDLKAYELHSKRKVGNITVQELCKIHTSIETLRLDDCDITDMALWTLGKYAPNIKGIYLAGCVQITNVGLRSFTLKCSELRIIDLSRCTQLDDVGLSSISAGCWSLEVIKLCHCTGITDDGLCHVTACRQLKHLDLTGCTNIGDFGSRILKEIGKYCSEMNYISFKDCKRVEDTGLIAISRGCPKLETFLGSSCDFVTVKGLKAVLKRLMLLKTLVLKGCSTLEDKDLHIAFHARNEVHEHTRDIHLSCISDPRKLKEARETYRDSLEELDISGAKLVSDKGVAWISQSSLRSSLLSLNLSQSRITDVSSKLIADNLTKLRNLDLSACPTLTDASIHTIATGVTAISTLKINSNTNITMNALVSHIGEYLPFAELATTWVGYLPKVNYQVAILAAERRHLESRLAIAIQCVARRKRAYLAYKQRYREHLVTMYIPQAQALVRGFQQRKRYAHTMRDKLRNKQATLIQSLYRTWIERCKLDRTTKWMRLQELRLEKSRLIQRVYRGMKGRKRAQAKRDDVANTQLAEAKRQAKRELRSIVIQRHFRAMLGRCIATRLREEREIRRLEEVRRDESCRLMQRVVRGHLGRNISAGLRRKAEEWRQMWYLTRRLQCMVRRYLARREALRRRMIKEAGILFTMCVKIQAQFRAHQGYLIGQQRRADRRRRKLEAVMSTRIQTAIRGFLARQRVTLMLATRRRENRENKAALLFQRVYRGHKGKEAAEVERELTLLEGYAAPLFILLAQYAEQAVKVTGQLQGLDQDLESLKMEVEESELELDAVLKNTARFSDSSRLNKTPQRFVTRYLRVRLRDYIVQKSEILRRKTEIRDKVLSRLHELRRLERKTQRELVPLTTGCIAKVKRGRGLRLRALVRRREAGAIKIQSLWRSVPVYRGFREPARDYWILCTDEEQTEGVYYYNTWTQQTSWDAPYIFKYLQTNTVPIAADAEEGEDQETLGEEYEYN